MHLVLFDKSARVLHSWKLVRSWASAHHCEPVTPYHSTQRVEGIRGGAQAELSECKGGQQARGMRWQHVFSHEQVGSDVGDPETKIRYVSSLVWFVDVLEFWVWPRVGLKLVLWVPDVVLGCFCRRHHDGTHNNDGPGLFCKQSGQWSGLAVCNIYKYIATICLLNSACRHGVCLCGQSRYLIRIYVSDTYIYCHYSSAQLRLPKLVVCVCGRSCMLDMYMFL